MNDFRAQAETELARREATCGRVTNREHYLDAIVRRLERQQSQLPGAVTGQAQDAIHRRNDEERQALPEAAEGDAKAAGIAWLEIMRRQLGRPRQQAQSVRIWEQRECEGEHRV